MSIRLNKALRELNIGLQTAVEFLEKKSELGEVKSDLSYKLSEGQYKALVEAFKQDAEVRSEAEKLFQKKPKDKKRAPEAKENRAENLLESSTQQRFKPVGKIDLDSIGKKPAAQKSVAPEVKAAAVSHEPNNKHINKPVEKPVVKAAVETPKPVVAKVETPKPAKPAEQPKVVAPKPVEAPKVVETPKVVEAPKPADKADDGIFTLKSEKKILNAPKMNVLGKIDLDSLNQSTRPKKKSKEEKRKEREEKTAQQHGGGERKKRVRINKARVDINAAVNQGGNNNNRNNNNRNKNNQNGANNANNNNAANNNNKKKNRKRSQKPLEVDDDAVARQVKETLARLTSKSQNKKGAKYRKEKRDAVQVKLQKVANAEQKDAKILKLTEFVTVSELATMMNIGVTQVISTLMSVGIMVSINQRLDAETINMVADEFGFKTEYVSAEVQEAVSEVIDDENDLCSRAPIVTVMGHVDHGKTSLLDHIRNTNVIAGEAGGITQHIGAYGVTLKNGQKVTFLDTPGHEAFTAMRARGAQVTDIAIIIIAADDSVMPTTKEAIAHAQAAGVPMVFAINKIDKPGANPDKIREDLSQMNLLVEEWGGKYQCQEISAKKGVGVDELLDKVLLEAEMLDLKANPNRKATGTIIESSLDKGRGYVSTVLVSNGTLKIGDVVIAGTSWGRIKAMFNERNQRIE
ncbi:MAG: translation initiation factor IF-2 [Prevotella sp.]